MAEVEVLHGIPMVKPEVKVKPGEFVFVAIGFNHPHIGGICQALIEAGATLKWVYDPEPKVMEPFLQKLPKDVKIATSEAEILQDPEVKLVASACITSERADLGIRVMEAGKDFFVDKAPLTTLEQLERVQRTTAKTGQKYMVYYSERLHNEESLFAEKLIKQGAIGKVIQTIGLGPHRLNAPSRPEWFFQYEKYGGILCDIGSHQIEQFLFYTGAEDATVVSAHVRNVGHPEFPELEDFGECTLVGNNGAIGTMRVDWFTPDGLRTWGDGRVLILGTEGYIELRKYVDITRDYNNGMVYLVNKEGEQAFDVHGKLGYPFFNQLIEDCQNRTEIAMTQSHALKAAELCVRAEMMAKI